LQRQDLFQRMLSPRPANRQAARRQVLSAQRKTSDPSFRHIIAYTVPMRASPRSCNCPRKGERGKEDIDRPGNNRPRASCRWTREEGDVSQASAD
jgi:hypothetical protein